MLVLGSVFKCVASSLLQVPSIHATFRWLIKIFLNCDSLLSRFSIFRAWNSYENNSEVESTVSRVKRNERNLAPTTLLRNYFHFNEISFSSFRGKGGREEFFPLSREESQVPFTSQCLSIWCHYESSLVAFWGRARKETAEGLEASHKFSLFPSSLFARLAARHEHSHFARLLLSVLSSSTAFPGPSALKWRKFIAQRSGERILAVRQLIAPHTSSEHKQRHLSKSKSRVWALKVRPGGGTSSRFNQNMQKSFLLEEHDSDIPTFPIKLFSLQALVQLRLLTNWAWSTTWQRRLVGKLALVALLSSSLNLISRCVGRNVCSWDDARW